MKRRADLIEEIAKYKSDITNAKNEIQKYPWDCENELYTLTRSDLLNIFERYLNNEITNDELFSWASFLECRDDLKYEEEAEAIIDKTIFWLANPEINYPINKQLIARLKKELLAN